MMLSSSNLTSSLTLERAIPTPINPKVSETLFKDSTNAFKSLVLASSFLLYKSRLS